MITFRCPKCGAGNDVSDKMEGFEVRCLSCKNSVTVPELKRDPIRWVSPPMTIPGYIAGSISFALFIFSGVLTLYGRNAGLGFVLAAMLLIVSTCSRKVKV